MSTRWSSVARQRLILASAGRVHHEQEDLRLRSVYCTMRVLAGAKDRTRSGSGGSFLAGMAVAVSVFGDLRFGHYDEARMGKASVMQLREYVPKVLTANRELLKVERMIVEPP